MFIVASTGRCGTRALCTALGVSSDHQVEHEPHPWLIREAFLKHTRGDWQTPDLIAALAEFAQRNDSRYGQSFRAPNLLEEVRNAAPNARFLILVRPPLEYIRSAHAMRVFRKGNVWDQTRILPLGLDLHSSSIAEKIAWHWNEVNRYLLNFAQQNPERSLIGNPTRMNDHIFGWARHLGVEIQEPSKLAEVLGRRDNASPESPLPDGSDPHTLMHICHLTWERAQQHMTSAEAEAEFVFK